MILDVANRLNDISLNENDFFPSRKEFSIKAKFVYFGVSITVFVL